MISAHKDFRERSAQVSRYILWLSREESSIQGGIASSVPKHILALGRSSALVMLYNLVESTMSNALLDIYSAMSSQNASFDALSSKVRQIILSNLKGHAPAKIESVLVNLCVDVHSKTFVKSEFFSGNVDAKLIRKTVKDYGVSTQFDYKEDTLLTIKSKRNSLAHGDDSFEGVGKDLTARDLIQYYWKVRRYLTLTLEDFEAFILCNGFLRAAVQQKRVKQPGRIHHPGGAP